MPSLHASGHQCFLLTSFTCEDFLAVASVMSFSAILTHALALTFRSAMIGCRTIETQVLFCKNPFPFIGAVYLFGIQLICDGHLHIGRILSDYIPCHVLGCSHLRLRFSMNSLSVFLLSDWCLLNHNRMASESFEKSQFSHSGSVRTRSLRIPGNLSGVIETVPLTFSQCLQCLNSVQLTPDNLNLQGN